MASQQVNTVIKGLEELREMVGRLGEHLQLSKVQEQVLKRVQRQLQAAQKHEESECDEMRHINMRP